MQSKFQSCRVNLDDLIVNVHDLISNLFNWFNFKPVTHQNHIFDILLTLLKVNTNFLFIKYFIRGNALVSRANICDKQSKY